MEGISQVNAIVGRHTNGPMQTEKPVVVGREREGKMSRLKSLSPPSDQLSSSSSLSTNTTDSDTSLKSMNQELLITNPLTSPNNNNHLETSPTTKMGPQGAKILIKYNYYDYNGARQEQTNQDMNYYALNEKPTPNKIPTPKIQRQLSPTFKESIERIVKNTQQAVEAANRSPVSPEHKENHLLQLNRRYKLSSYEQRCFRCKKTVYQMDKVGPLRDFTFYHQNCFKCRECGTKLTLKTYYNNQRSSTDQEVYCHNHCPKTNPGKLDNHSVGILAALNAPKVFDALAGPGNHPLNEYGGGRGSPVAGAGGGGGGLSGSASAGGLGSSSGDNGSPNVDSRALYIQHAVQQTRLQNMYKNNKQPQPQQKQQLVCLPQVDDKQLSQLINRRLEFLEPKQKLLEMRHREEEDALFKAFEMKWLKEESCISEQICQEWQVELGKLLDKYKRQLSSISANQQHQQQHPVALSQHELLKLARADLTRQQQTSEQQMIEFERMNLEKSMTIKLDRKKETLKRKLKEFERQATAELVEKQSREMLALISIKLEEYKEEQKRKIGADLEQFEAIDSLANQLGSTLRLSGSAAADLRSSSAQVLRTEAPAPMPPQISKMELYNNEDPDVVFKTIDELAINVAKADQRTFTDLVHHLTRNCITDVEKVRAIFRWITVKNLNTMHFDASVKPDTPLGLLRGIKNGSESYHVLFKRLCSYAGLHCVVIKGYSKSAGYQPGVKFEGNRFRNSWNAVFVAGAWRFVQCNWGARHLVSVAVMQDKSQQQPTKTASDLMNGRGGTPAASAARYTGLEPTPNRQVSPPAANYGRRGMEVRADGCRHSKQVAADGSQLQHSRKQQLYQSGNGGSEPGSSSSSSSSPTSILASSPVYHSESARCGGARQQLQHTTGSTPVKTPPISTNNDSLRYEYDDHYFLTDPDEFIYEFYPLSPEWQLIRCRPITVTEFEQLPFVRSLFFKYGLYFPQQDIRSVLYTDSSGATTIKIGMPTHMIPSLIFHYNLKYYHSDAEHYEGVSLKRFVMQSIESGTCESSNGQTLLSNIVSFRVHLPENGSYILDIFANSTVSSQYTSGEPMKFKSVCKFKVVAKNLKTVMIPLPDCASGEYGPMKATRSFGLIPITHENGLIVVKNEKRFLEIQFRITRPLLDFMASLHKNGYDEKLLSKSIKIFIESDIVHITIKFTEDGQYGLDLYTRDSIQHHQQPEAVELVNSQLTKDGRHLPDRRKSAEANKQLLTHCCKYLINVKTT